MHFLHIPFPYGGFHTWYPMAGLKWEFLFKLVIQRYHHFRTPPLLHASPFCGDTPLTGHHASHSEERYDILYLLAEAVRYQIRLRTIGKTPTVVEPCWAAILAILEGKQPNQPPTPGRPANARLQSLSVSFCVSTAMSAVSIYISIKQACGEHIHMNANAHHPTQIDRGTRIKQACREHIHKNVNAHHPTQILTSVSAANVSWACTLHTNVNTTHPISIPTPVSVANVSCTCTYER